VDAVRPLVHHPNDKDLPLGALVWMLALRDGQAHNKKTSMPYGLHRN
jgi:hypothetical protein